VKNHILTFGLGLILTVASTATALAQSVPVSSTAAFRHVPELNGSTAALALALVAGGFAIAHGRRRRARR